MEGRRVLPAQPVLDTLALVLVLNAFPEYLVSTIMALLVAAKGLTLQRLGTASTVFLGALASGTDKFWLVWRLWAVCALASALVSRRSVMKRALAASLGMLAVDGCMGLGIIPQVRSPNSLDGPDAAYLGRLYSLTLAAVLVGATGSLPIASGYMQPMWTLAAKIWCLISYPRRRLVPREGPPIRFVESHAVGFLVATAKNSPIAEPVLVNGTAWSQVFHDRQAGLVVVQGLESDRRYVLALGGMVFEVATLPAEDEEGGALANETDDEQQQQQQRSATKTSRKLRKDATRQLAQLRADRDALAAKIARSARGDARVHRKVQTLRDQTRQLQEEVDEMMSQGHPHEDSLLHSPEAAMNDELQTACAEAELNLEQVRDHWSYELRTKEQELSRLRQRSARLHDRLEKFKADKENTHESAAVAVQQLLLSRQLARQNKEIRRARLESEFKASIERLQAGVADSLQRSALVKESAGQWA